MRRWLAVVLALLAAPAAAQQAPAWVGVWDGRVGTFPVKVCLDSWGDDIPGRGSYYYLSQLEPIQLSDAGDGMWIERAAGSDVEAEWFIEQIADGAMRGLWRQGSRELRFELAAREWSESKWGGACGSAEFLAPRVRPAQVSDLAAAEDGWAYTRRIYRPPAHFRDEVTIETFSFAPEQPGDARINAVLESYLPRGSVEDDFLQCLAGGIASLGTDGYFETTVRPMLVSRAFLGVDQANSDFCGGAHPNHWQVMHLFDRHSGDEIDLFDWLGVPRVEGEPSPLADGLRELILARWPRDGDSECSVYAEDADDWSLGLTSDGIMFQPDLPHAATACEERITIEWRALAPFLDAEGRAGLARMRGG